MKGQKLTRQERKNGRERKVKLEKKVILEAEREGPEALTRGEGGCGKGRQGGRGQRGDTLRQRGKDAGKMEKMMRGVRDAADPSD